MTRYTVLAFAVVFSRLLTSSAHADLIIDDFNQPGSGQIAEDTTIGGIVVNSQSGLSDVLGGSRELFADKTGPSGSTTPVKISANEFNTDILNFDQFSSTARGTGRIIYDGFADGMLDPLGLKGIDLTQGGLNQSFIFKDVAVTGSGLSLTVNLYNALTGNVYTTGPQLLSNGFLGILKFDYATDFSGLGGASTPLNVGAIEILIDGSSADARGSDLTFDLVTSATVPEPSSMVLCGIASLVGVGYRLRQRKTSKTA